MTKLDHEPHNSVFSDEERSEIEATIEASGADIPHEDFVATLSARFH